MAAETRMPWATIDAHGDAGAGPLVHVYEKVDRASIYTPGDIITVRSRKDGLLLPRLPMKNRVQQVARCNEMLDATHIGPNTPVPSY